VIVQSQRHATIGLVSHTSSHWTGMDVARVVNRQNDHVAATRLGHGREPRVGQDIPIELKLPFQSIAVTTATTQISSLVFCLAWSVKFNFYESTATHCRVDNYLPSLSATLDFTPQRDVWRTCIGLSGVPRFFIAYLYYHIVYKSTTLLWLHWIEILALIGLSIVDSIRYFSK
jgi:hypothetical protein